MIEVGHYYKRIYFVETIISSPIDIAKNGLQVDRSIKNQISYKYSETVFDENNKYTKIYVF